MLLVAARHLKFALPGFTHSMDAHQQQVALSALNSTDNASMVGINNSTDGTASAIAPTTGEHATTLNPMDEFRFDFYIMIRLEGGNGMAMMIMIICYFFSKF